MSGVLYETSCPLTDINDQEVCQPASVASVISILGPYLSLQDVARLALCSRILCDGCLQIAGLAAPRRLISAAVAALRADGSLQIGHPQAPAAVPANAANGTTAQDVQDTTDLLKAVQWLQRNAPHVAELKSLTEGVHELVQIPNIPLTLAVQLVSAGERISYKQLMKAVCARVSGVEVWVQAQQQLGVETDIPTAAVDICCCRMGEEVSTLPKDDSSVNRSDLLQLAINCQVSSCADSATQQLLSEHTEQQLAMDLLKTTVLRGHVDAAKRIIDLLAAQQLPPGLTEQLIAAILHMDWPDTCYYEDMTHVLCCGGQADALSAAQVLRLLHSCIAATQARRRALWRVLYNVRQLSAVQEISPAEVLDLLRSEILQHKQVDCDSGAVSQLCEIPAAQQLGMNDLNQLAQLAMQQGCGAAGSVVQSMCRLNLDCAASAIETHALAGLLQATLPPDVAQWALTKWVMTSDSESAATQQPSSEQLQSLLQAAIDVRCQVELYSSCSIQVDDVSCIRALCKLPAASELRLSAAATLMQAVLPLLQQDEYRSNAVYMLEYLCGLPEAKQLGAATVQQVVQGLVIAAPIGAKDLWHRLYCLPAVRDIGADEVVRLMLLVFERHGAGAQLVLHHLCGLPTAQYMSTQDILLVVEAAMRAKSSPVNLMNLLRHLQKNWVLSVEQIVLVAEQHYSSHDVCRLQQLLVKAGLP